MIFVQSGMKFFRNRLPEEAFVGVHFEDAKNDYFQAYRDEVHRLDPAIVVTRHPDLEDHYDDVMISLREVGGIYRLPPPRNGNEFGD